MKLILIRGLPGSGKSTLAKTFDHSIHIEADQYWGKEYKFDPAKLGAAHQWCQRMCESDLERCFVLYSCMTVNMSVIVSNTFTTKKELKPYFEIAKKFGIVPIVIHCQNNFGSIHNVPEETIKKMKTRWEHDISELFEI